VLITQPQAQKILLEASKSGIYQNQPADIMAVEVWAKLLPELNANGGEHPSLLARIHPELDEHYAAVVEKRAAFVTAREEATRAQEKLDKEEDKLDHAAKNAAKARLEVLEAKADAANAAFEDAKDAFIPEAKAIAAKVGAPVRDETGPIIVRFREAVADADTANGAAMVRYPLAVTSLVGDAQKQAAVFLADIIEEKSGKRPTLDGVTPTVSLDGITPEIGINGLSSKHLGKLNVADVTQEAVKRTGEWVTKAASLMVWAPSTSAALSYQADVLDAILEGYEEAGWTRSSNLEIEPKDGEEAED
jgi:hypothetical protein